MSNTKFKFEVWKTYVNKIGEMLLNDNYFISEIFKKDESNYNKFKTDYENNFIKYKTNERFTIPIIGKISSGKSTFLNSILLGNYLSSSSRIETKFICIIRNKKGCKSPTFYTCKLKIENLDYKYKNFKYYYCEKGDELKGDILENIKNINSVLTNYEKKINMDERDINKYFYILELDIQLFDMNPEFSDFFELMDIPGLNEKDDFYLQKIIPILVNKCLFSIYIFDLEHYENEDTSDIYKKYSEQLNKFYNTNSIYILNKIDFITEADRKKFKDEEYHFKRFKDFLSSDNKNSKEPEKEFHVDLNKNFFLKLNSKEIFNKVNAFYDLKTYILHLIDTIKPEDNIGEFGLLDYIKNKFVEYFEITQDEVEEIFNDSEGKYNEEYDEKEYNEINDNITSKGFTPDFEEDEYKKFMYIFNNKKKIYLNIPELNLIYKTINEAMEKSLEDFFNWNNVLELMKNFKDSINRIFEKEDHRKKYIAICDDLLNSFQEEIDRKIKLKNIDWNINVLDPLKIIIDSLINLEKSNESLQRLKEEFNSLTYFIYNYRKIRIPLLGGYSTGKSSFLNNMIGKDILPVDINRCTNRGIILRHNKNKISPPQLFKTKFTHVENPEYWYFKDEKEPICEGYEQIKQKLIDLNNEDVKFEDAFVVLKIHLNLFSEIDFSNNKILKENLEDKLELIDFPGLDVKNNFYKEEIFSPLMRFSDGFIFVNECDLIQESGNLKILSSIINQITTRKFSFSFKSSLFLLHKLDKSLDLDIGKSKEIFENLLIADRNNKEEFNVDKFSSKLYHIYIDFFNKYITNFEAFIKYIFENLVKPEEKRKIKNFGEFLKIINNISKKLKFQINKKLIINNNNKLVNDLKDDNLNLLKENLFKIFNSLKLDSNINGESIENVNASKIINDIYSNYLYLNNNFKAQNQRVLSNANSLFESLCILFRNSYDYTEVQFKKYFNYFIENFNNLFIFIDLKIYGDQLKNQIIYNEIEKENKDLEKKANESYVNSKKYIENKKEEFYNKNQKLRDDFINNKYNTIEKFIDFEHKIQRNINEFSKKVNNKINNFNKIIEDLKIGDKKINNITINYSTKILNKNTENIQKYIYQDNIVENIFSCIGNLFINLNNLIKEKEQIQNNIDNYLLEINSLIENTYKTFNSELEVKKAEILKTINNNLLANNNNFNGIKQNRNEYETIKRVYFKIIKNKNLNN